MRSSLHNTVTPRCPGPEWRSHAEVLRARGWTQYVGQVLDRLGSVRSFPALSRVPCTGRSRRGGDSDWQREIRIMMDPFVTLILKVYAATVGGLLDSKARAVRPAAARPAGRGLQA